MKGRWLGLVLIVSQAFAGTETPRAQQTKAHFEVYSKKLHSNYERLKKNLSQYAPSLLALLKPTPPRQYKPGYQVLPVLLPASLHDHSATTQSTSYSWPLTDQYIDREISTLEEMDEKFSVLPRLKSHDKKEILAKMAEDYKLLRTNFELIDHHIQHNEFWQNEILHNPKAFDRLTLQKLQTPRSVPRLRLEKPTPESFIFHLTLMTDIQDLRFLQRFTTTIEKIWTCASKSKIYGLRLHFQKVQSKKTFHDLESHLSHFDHTHPVLTTGALATHAVVGRYIALGPQPLSEQTLAHEFGHVLGFLDSYYRGYKNLGPDGFEIIETVPDTTDIMAMPQEGRPQLYHFEALLRAVQTSDKSHN